MNNKIVNLSLINHLVALENDFEYFTEVNSASKNSIKDYVIFSGGTGSKQIQKALLLEKNVDPRKIEIIINMYDDGKSTGRCRQLFDILGPSDLRKNHETQANLIYGPDGIVERYLKESSDETDMDIYIHKTLQVLLFRHELINSIMSKRMPKSPFFKRVSDINSGTSALSSYNEIMYHIDTCFINIEKKINEYNKECINSNNHILSIHPSDVLYPANIEYNQDCTHYNEFRKSVYYVFFRDIVTSFFKKTYSNILKDDYSLSAYPKIMSKDNYVYEISLFDLTLLKQKEYFDLDDFSIGNIVYSVLIETAKNIKNLESKPVEAASKLMCSILNIPDNVSLISERNFYLKGTVGDINIPEVNLTLPDEASIVDFGKNLQAQYGNRISETRYIKDVYLEDRNSTGTFKTVHPVVGEDRYGNPVNNNFIRDLVALSKNIIISSGTFWSSLYPTFYHSDFKDVLRDTNGTITVVMNRVQDFDMPNTSINDYILLTYDSLFDSPSSNDNWAIKNNKKINLIMDSTSDYNNSFDKDKLEESCNGILKTLNIFKRQLTLASERSKSDRIHNYKKLATVLK